jgi:hypothetical protein
MMDCWGSAEIVENGIAIMIELLGIQFGTKISLSSIEA